MVSKSSYSNGIMHHVLLSIYTIHYTEYSIPYTLYRIQYSVYTIQYTVYTIQYTAYSEYTLLLHNALSYFFIVTAKI